MKDENGNTPWGGSVSFTSRSDDTRSVLNSVYFRFNDYYTWDDEGTRLLKITFKDSILVREL